MAVVLQDGCLSIFSSSSNIVTRKRKQKIQKYINNFCLLAHNLLFFCLVFLSISCGPESPFFFTFKNKRMPIRLLSGKRLQWLLLTRECQGFFLIFLLILGFACLHVYEVWRAFVLRIPWHYWTASKIKINKIAFASWYKEWKKRDCVNENGFYQNEIQKTNYVVKLPWRK